MSDKPDRLPEATEIIRRLQTDLGYSKEGAESVVEELAICHDEVKRAFEAWWVTGRLDTMEVAGWSAQKIAEHVGCLPPTAILNLDWLLTDPVAASAALQRGFDRIMPEGTGVEPEDAH